MIKNFPTFHATSVSRHTLLCSQQHAVLFTLCHRTPAHMSLYHNTYPIHLYQGTHCCAHSSTLYYLPCATAPRHTCCSVTTHAQYICIKAHIAVLTAANCIIYPVSPHPGTHVALSQHMPNTSRSATPKVLSPRTE
jgi:hypothetical protein